MGNRRVGRLIHRDYGGRILWDGPATEADAATAKIFQQPQGLGAICCCQRLEKKEKKMYWSGVLGPVMKTGFQGYFLLGTQGKKT